MGRQQRPIGNQKQFHLEGFEGEEGAEIEKKDARNIDITVDDGFAPVAQEVFDSIDADAEKAGGAWREPEEYVGSIGRTMFDTPSSKDNSITVLLPRESMQKAPSQSLLRIKSQDGRSYLGIVTEGPFAEPDAIRGDSPIVVTTTVKGGIFMPQFHGRVQVEILGEEEESGMLIPPRFRPLPNSPVFALDSSETAKVLKLEGDIRLGLAVGHENLEVRIPSDRKSVLPRHVGILGTTGGGKSTTVSGLIYSFQKAGIATVLIDTEGEYTMINEPTEDSTMTAALERRGLRPDGVRNSHIYHLVGRETTNPHHQHRTSFCLTFDKLSPYLVMELLELTEAQESRYLRAYDITKYVLKELGISPQQGEDPSRFFDVDEMEEGYPRMTLAQMYDIIAACAQIIEKAEDNIKFYAPEFRNRSAEVIESIKRAINADGNTKKTEGSLPGNVGSWRALQGKLGRIRRLKIFDNPQAESLNYDDLTRPGQVSIIDLSDTDSPRINNLVIAEILRGIQEQQDRNYVEAEKAGKQPRRTIVIIEEAHEFLSAERIRQMPVLFQQVARIARRGRKRWLGLVFVTQLPQHLPDEVLGLINNFILHKIADSGIINRLKRSISGIDESLWSRLPGLAPGQAIVSMAGMARPLLVAIDPTPCKLRMVD
jgi:DNA helicase HerA-like ATPase